ncbi:MAG: sigma-70 family RNA polymerase sigma factor [Planctomycetales bacterium]|nr:sigma-70 family RNA polymerase sigma factor [Planctomycetales bacterium]
MARGTAEESPRATAGASGPAAASGPDPDAELVARAARRDPEAFDALVLRHQDRIYSALLRLLGDAEAARDAAQETFLKAWQALPRFEQRAMFSTWIYRIAINVSLSRRRSDRAHPDRKALPLETGSDPEGEEAEPRRIPEPVSRDGNPGAALEGEEARQAVTRAIAALDPDFRTTIVMRDIQGLSYEEIAETLGIPVGTVRSRIHRGREMLREALAPFVSGAPPSGTLPASSNGRAP